MDKLESSDLSTIVTKLHSIGNVEENLLPWKQALCLLVARVTEGNYEAANNSEKEVCVEFVKHCLSTAPQMFANDDLHNGKNTYLHSTEATNKNVEFDLTYWITNRLIYMLTQVEENDVLEERAIEILVNLVQNVSLKNCRAFSKFASEYVRGLANLCAISEEMYDQEKPNFTFALQEFYTDNLLSSNVIGEVRMAYKQIVLNSQETCERLQIIFSQILIKISLNVCLFMQENALGETDKTNSLWKSVVAQLELGEVLLKTVTLNLISKLLLYGKLPAGQILDYLLECMAALIDLLCGGYDECPGDYIALEKATVEVLGNMIKHCRCSEVQSSITEMVFNSIAMNIMKNIGKHGSFNLKTKDLRRCLYNTLAEIYDGKVNVHMVEEETIELARTVVKEIGLSDDSQYCINWLQTSMLLDMNNHCLSTQNFLNASTLDCNGDGTDYDYIPTKRAKKLALRKSSCGKETFENVSSITPSGLLMKSHTALMINRRLLTLQQLTRDSSQTQNEVDIKYIFEGIKTTLQLLVWAMVKFVHEENGSIGCDFLNESNVISLLNMWKEFILDCSVDTKLEVLVDCYSIIIDSVGCIIFAQDILTISPELFQLMTWLLSMYWLPAEMSWMDLKLASEHKNLTRVCNKLADKLNHNIMEKCVLILAFIPKEIASKWRTYVLKSALSDTVDIIRSSAVRCFPFYLCQMGPNANHLVYDILHPLIKDKNTEVLAALADIIGPLSCTVTGRALINRELTIKTHLLPVELIHIKCGICEDIVTDDNTSSSKERLKNVEPSMFSPFVELVQRSHDIKVKKYLVQSLVCLFRHINVGSSAENPSSILVSQYMPLLSDPDHTIRMEFSKSLRCILSEGGSGSIVHAEVLIIEAMKKVVRSARSTKNTSLMESILHTTGYLAKYAEDSFLVLMIVVLLDNICQPLCSLVGSVAHNQLKLVAKTKHVELPHLFVQFGKKFCKVVADNMYESEETNSQMEPLDIVKEVVDAFEFESISQFLKKTEPCLLPHLVKKGTLIGTRLIKVVAKQVGDPNHKGPVYRNIGHIYCHIVCTTESEEFTRLCHYLEDIFEKPLVEFLSAGKNMEFDLLLHLASHKSQVLRGFRFYLSKLDENIAEEVSTDEGIAKVLQPKLLGMFVHLDNYLNNGTIEIHEKKKAYESLMILMELMGPSRISAVRVRMMTTLKIGLKFSGWGFPYLCCRAWNCFVRSIDIKSVGSMLSQIIVSLLPLLQQMPKQVADIFNYLIVDNRKELCSHFHELYFIPDIEELKDVNAVLKHYTEGKYSVKDNKVRIESLLKGISHESKDVRQHALTKLQDLLHSKKEVLHSYILGSENVHPVVSKIVLALLDGCRDSSPSLRALYGACLGELGAVDPGRIQILNSRTKEDIFAFHDTVNNHAFCFELVCKLSQAYLRAVDRSVQDLVAYAIQSLIQIYGITDDTEENSPGHKIWRRFPEEVQEVITPLLTSRYMMTAVYKWNNLHKPIYRGGRKGFTFDTWVCTLTSYLGACITEAKPKEVFDVCRGVLRTNSQVALFLLPYAVVHILLEENEENVTDIANEVLAVLNHAKDPDTPHGNSSDLSHLSAQTVFSVLDHLVKWLRHRVVTLSTIAATNAARSRQHHASVDINYKNDIGYQKIKAFLDRIPLDILAQASYNCGAYTRSLMHYEQFIKAIQGDVCMEEHFDFMQKLYASMDEPDGVTGITAIKQTQPTLNEQILAYESAGQLSDALVCYDRAVKLDPQNLSLRQGLLKCRLALGELNSAMEQANGIIVERPEWKEHINEFRVESAWKLGQWDKLQCFIDAESQSKSWNTNLGRIFLAARNADEVDFDKQIQISHNELMGPLCAASMEFGSYQRGYEYIAQLHMLNEMEQCLRTLFHLHTESSQPIQLKELLKHWEQRLQLTQSSFRVQEPILNLRRAVLTLARESKDINTLDQEIGLSWLQTAKIARGCGLVQAAHSSLLSASCFNLPEFCIENAKWLWDRGDFDKAQVCLEKAVDEYYPDKLKYIEGHGKPEERFACAQVLLLLGTYREQTASLESSAMMRHFKEVSKVYGQWEDSYFTCAKYFDKVMTNVVAEKPEKKGDFIIHVVSNLGQSLQYGSQYIYQSMPRMLSLWMDFGADLAEPDKYSRNESTKVAMESVLSLLNNKIGMFTERLPSYQFLTAFPQLISRICHAHPEVFSRLKDMIANLLVAYPQQAMWGMMAVSKSSYQMRNKRCQEIFSQARSIKSNLNKFLLDSHKLTERLLDLCNRSVEQSVNTISISQHFKPLQRLVDDKDFSPIMLPLQSLMTVTLPSASNVHTAENHNPFPNDNVYIRGLEDTVELLSSLQRPKKVNLRGSDGKNYIMLCKPKDDLRKDARLMEFNSIVNKCLHKDPESRRRNLNIRTFAVTPLNEECGMLEWVQNTASLRYILNKLYRERGVFTTGKELRSMQLPPNASLQRKLDTFRNKLLPRHMPLFSEWFLKTFADPTSWYNARLAYCRTIAVMSMVGYILGLGDRHGENILLDSTTGECVHVDFNCLFNKGETFDYPEIVPFRLTHNMIDAMGPLGYEGVFRRACEVCLRVMRDQNDSLMSVLKSFIYDPLVEWSKPSKGRSNPTESGEIKNEKAQTHVSNIESRLKGILKTKSKLKGLPLSVEGHVNHLIKEASDENNLCQMYIGWAPYL